MCVCVCVCVVLCVCCVLVMGYYVASCRHAMERYNGMGEGGGSERQPADVTTPQTTAIEQLGLELDLRRMVTLDKR